MNKFYFSHDQNARNDEKMLVLRARHGMGGYGIYWIIIEMMHETDDGYLDIDLITEGLSYQYNIDITELNTVITTCISVGLFLKGENNEKKITSKRVQKNKKELQEYREKKSLAGKKGMNSRWKDNTVITNDNNINKRKVNKIIEKENKEKDIVTLTVADDLNSLIGMFKEVNPSYEKLYRNTTQRKALQDMLSTHGRDKVEWSINYAKRVYGKQYAPQITTPVQLEQKLGSLIAYAKSKEDKKPIIAVMPTNL